MAVLEDAVEQLVAEIPEFRPRYLEDVARWGKPLPTSLLGAFARFVGELLDQPGGAEQALVTRSLAALEHLWESYDREAMVTLLGTGFLESFDEWLPRARARLGPGLLSLVETEERWTADRLARGVGTEPGDRRP